MLKRLFIFLFAAVAPAAAAFAENVHTSAGFETGKFQPVAGFVDAFFVRTLPHPQSGNDYINTGNGGGGPNSNWDTKVVRNETVDGQLVTPRNGDFFARSMLYYNKDYSGINGNGEPKPRSAMSLGREEHRYNYDEEGWLGVSIFLPNDFEDETVRRGAAGSIMIIESATDSSAQFFQINVFVPEGKNEAHWVFRYMVGDRSVDNSKGEKRIGFSVPVEPDKGKWTDFVIRYRANPFTRDTNPAQAGIRNAKNKLYRGNRGILQVWKSQGSVQPNGERRMERVFSRVNQPVGLVPGTHQGKSKIFHSMRVYKYGWQREATAVKGPIWIGFDEFRYGQVIADGTGYSDVHPSGRACTDRCPGGDAARPKAPTDLNISR